MTDRKGDTSNALTEIRTVRSRAQSAIDKINLSFLDGRIERRPVGPTWQDGEYVPGYEEFYRDEDADEMVALLEDFVKKTERFAKGRRGA